MRPAHAPCTLQRYIGVAPVPAHHSDSSTSSILQRHPAVAPCDATSMPAPKRHAHSPKQHVASALRSGTYACSQSAHIPWQLRLLATPICSSYYAEYVILSLSREKCCCRSLVGFHSVVAADHNLRRWKMFVATPNWIAVQKYQKLMIPFRQEQGSPNRTAPDLTA